MIDKTAIISKKAILADNVEVGPYAVIKDGVKIAEGCRIGPHCVLEGNTTIGPRCTFHPGAVIGSPPQDLKYKGEKSFIVIGADNIFREYVTVNPGTSEGSTTTIADSNLLMAYSHVAHDCSIGSHNVIANVGTLAGHVTIEDHVVIGGLVAVHQFCRVGKFSIIGGCSKVVQDIPPFSTCDGHPAQVFAVNLVGLRRHGFSAEEISLMKKAFKELFFSELTITHGVERIRASGNPSAHVKYLVDFATSSRRGLCRPTKAPTKEPSDS